MLKYNTVFNWNSIYEYPFSNQIEAFFIIWWNNINILRENDFNILLNYFKINKIINISVENKWFINTFDVKNFNYELYKNTYLWKWNHNIFWWKNQWIALSEEFFWLIWWDKDFIDFMVKNIWVDDLIERLHSFMNEWESSKKWNWSYNLLNKTNIIEFKNYLYKK